MESTDDDRRANGTFGEDNSGRQPLVEVIGDHIGQDPSPELVDVSGGVWTCRTPQDGERGERDGAEQFSQGFGELTQLLQNLQSGSAENEPVPASSADTYQPSESAVGDEDELSRLVAELDAEYDVNRFPAALQLAQSPLFHTEMWQEDAMSVLENCTCSICLASFVIGQEVTTIVSCNHVYHLQCLRRWMEAPPFSCPVCRVDAADLQSAPAVALEAAGGAAKRHGWQPVPKQPAQRSLSARGHAATKQARLQAGVANKAAFPAGRVAQTKRGGSAVVVAGSFGHVLPSRLPPASGLQQRNAAQPGLPTASRVSHNVGRSSSVC